MFATTKNIVFRLILSFLVVYQTQAYCNTDRVDVLGFGSAIPALFYTDFSILYSANRSRYNRDVWIQYNKTTTGTGKQRILNDNGQSPVHFAASESLLSATQEKAYPTLVSFPLVAGALVMLYNLPGISNLTLNVNSLAKIYMGQITHWNDNEIAWENPNITLPAMPILPVARYDTSGDTEIFTRLLNATSRVWANQYGVFIGANFTGGVCCASRHWPANTIVHYGRSVNGMTGVIMSIPYTIGYVALANVAETTGATYAHLRNSVGAVTTPTNAAIQAAMNYRIAELASSNLTSMNFDILNVPDSRAYPIASLSYMILNRTTTAGVSCCQMEELVGFIDYLLDVRASVIESYGLVSVTPMIARKVRSNILSEITCNGNVAIFQAYRKSLVATTDGSVSPTTWVTIVLAILLTILSAALLLYWHKLRTADDAQWLIPSARINLTDSGNKSSPGEYNGHKNNSVSSVNTSLSVQTNVVEPGHRKFLLRRARLGDEEEIFLSLLPLTGNNPKHWSVSVKRRIFYLHRAVSAHDNVLRLLGVTSIVGDIKALSVYQYAAKGTLHYVMAYAPYNLDDVIKYYISVGVAAGLAHLHRYGIVHGLLSSLSCYLDATWSPKVAQWEETTLYREEQSSRIARIAGNTSPNRIIDVNLTSSDNDNETEEITLIKWLYVDRRYAIYNICDPTVDVFSFGLLMIEIFTRELPYANDSKTYKQIVDAKQNMLAQVPLPVCSATVPDRISMLIDRCLGDPSKRPTFKAIVTTLNYVLPKSKGIVDVLMDTMEDYMRSLENKVSEKTAAHEELLYAMLPRPIATKLLSKQHIEPEYFDCVTVFFSDIVGFTSLSEKLRPVQVLEMLNRVYLTFDDIAAQHDVYKVETIGDAYMACSGLPVRNDITHVQKVAQFALCVKEIMINSFRAVTFDDSTEKPHQLSVRIGVNSGPVTAGVIGSKMPRYCVFGDTVNTASRMESTSQPMRIQLSTNTQQLLVKHFPNQFCLACRGYTNIKGKGQMLTYWLSDLDKKHDSEVQDDNVFEHPSDSTC